MADALVDADAKVFSPFMENRTREQSIKFINENPRTITQLRERIRGILDWLQHPTTRKQNLRELSFEEAERKAKEWHEELKTTGGDINYQEPTDNIILKEYPKNDFGIEYYWVLIPSHYCDIESARMGHCGRTNVGNVLISLRSKRPYSKNDTITDSHVTIAYGKDDSIFYQVKGKKNQKPSEKYFPYIYDLVFSLTDENSELKNKFKKQIEKLKESREYIINKIKDVYEKLNKYLKMTMQLGEEYIYINYYSKDRSKPIQDLKNLFIAEYDLYDLSFKLEKLKFIDWQSEYLFLFQNNDRNIFKLKEKLYEVRNIREYEEVENEIKRLEYEPIKIFKEIEPLVIEIEKLMNEYLNIQIPNYLNLDFEGFGSEYSTSDDYGWEEMTKEEIEKIKNIKPELFNNFKGSLILYEKGIITEKPNTTIEINYDTSKYYQLNEIIDHDDYSQSFISDILSGNPYDFISGNFEYFFEEASQYVSDLNNQQKNDIIDKIVEITNYPKSEVEQNGIEYYLDGEDENFDRDDFEEIRRSIAIAGENAEVDGYQEIYYNELKSALLELGEISEMNDERLVMKIDLANHLSIESIVEYLQELETNDLEEVFLRALANGDIEKPKFRIDDRTSPYIDISDYFDIYNY